MRKIFVTGGAGFIGANFVHHILKNHPEDRITVFDRLTYSGNLANLQPFESDARLSFVRGDVADNNDIEGALTGTFTHVVHFAAESHVDRSILGPAEFVRTNVVGTHTILERLRALGWGGRSDRRMVHISTDEVYGSLGETGYFSEETAYRPNSPYSASKAASDHLVRAYFHTYDLPVVTTNCSNNYGPYQFPEKLIPLMILNALRGKELPIYGNGTNVRDWLHVEDHCGAIDLVMRSGRDGETYAVGGRSERRNIDIVKKICEILDRLHPEGAPHERLIGHVRDRPGHDQRYAIDCTKIERELGWRAAHTFENGIEETVRWYLDHREWWEEILSGDYSNYYKKQYYNR
jgi:dTDP-glucose 4,6-dehydratase